MKYYLPIIAISILLFGCPAKPIVAVISESERVVVAFGKKLNPKQIVFIDAAKTNNGTIVIDGSSYGFADIFNSSDIGDFVVKNPPAQSRVLIFKLDNKNRIWVGFLHGKDEISIGDQPRGFPKLLQKL